MLDLFKRLALPAVAIAYCTGTNLQSAEPANTARNQKRVTTPPAVRLVKQTTETEAPPEPMPDLTANPDPKASLLDNQRQMTILQTAKLRNEVSNAVETARRMDDPVFGISALKHALGAVTAALDISP